MRMFRPMSQPIACAALVLIFAAVVIVVVAAAQTQKTCPPIIASLLPKNGSIREGQYFTTAVDGGHIGKGSGSADIPFEHRCIKSIKFPARVSIKVDYYGGEAVELFKMHGDAPNNQFMTEEFDGLNVEKETLRPQMSKPKREKLAGGEIVYAEYMSECPPEKEEMADVGEMIVPNIKLSGATRTGHAKLQVKLEGSISVDAAKAAVAEVFQNLKKADFSKAK